MHTAAERRDTRRIVVGAEHTIRFLVKGHAFRDVRLTNLSIGGCFAVLGQGDAPLFERGTVLEALAFEHPEMPSTPGIAVVVYVLGTESGQGILDYVGLGLRFLSLPGDVEGALERLVSEALGSGGCPNNG